MLKMLSSTLQGRRTAKVPLVKEKNDKRGNQKFLAMKSFTPELKIHSRLGLLQI